LKSQSIIKGTEFFLVDGACPFVRDVLTLVGDKWSVLVIVLLGGGAIRFNDLKRTIEGISQRMLTRTLRGLERDGLVMRSVHPTIPPSVEYALTPLGRTLLKSVSELANWVRQSQSEIEQARALFDRRSIAP